MKAYSDIGKDHFEGRNFHFGVREVALFSPNASAIWRCCAMEGYAYLVVLSWLMLISTPRS